jgi:hypothetical protein
MMITTTIRRPWDGSLDHAACIPVARFREAATHLCFETNENPNATNPNGRQAKEPWVITDQLSVAGSKKTNESSSPVPGHPLRFRDQQKPKCHHY